MAELLPDRLALYPPLNFSAKELGPYALSAHKDGIDGGFPGARVREFEHEITMYYETILPERIVEAAESNRDLADAGTMLDCVPELDRQTILNDFPVLADHQKPREVEWPNVVLKEAVALLEHSQLEGSDREEHESMLADEIYRTVADENTSPHEKKKALWQIEWVSTNMTDRAIELAFILGQDERVTNTAAAVLEYATQDATAALIEAAIVADTTGSTAKLRAANAIASVQDPLTRDGLYDLASHFGIAPSLTGRSALHDLAQESGLSRIPKTGSPSYVLPAKHEALVRTMNADSFYQWFRLYRDIELWEDLGLGYVPVEPIVNFGYGDSFEVYATSKVIRGQSMEDSLLGYAPEIQQSVLAQRENIRGAVRKAGVRHGHDHKRNFILAPVITDDAVRVDLPPASYLIDFDLATYRNKRF